jgi:sortase A
VVRFVAAVMMTSGALLITDAIVTVLWQEPISYLLASREQAKIREKLRDPPPRVVRRRPLPGDAIGQIRFPTLDRSYYVVEGTRAGDLRRGPGHYPDTPLPGERGTTAIAGHRTTYGAPFRNIDDLRSGDHVIVSLPWGRFRYRVERSRIVPPTALWVKRRVGHDRLVLSACHPLYSAAERIVVFARLVTRQPPDVRRS